MLKIMTVPGETEILRRKSRPILKFDDELAEFLRELGETLKGQKDPAGVGLSAIQVGRAIRAFAMFLPVEKDTESKGPTLPRQGRTLSKPELVFYVNPEISEHAVQMTLGEELIENREHPPAGEAGRTESSKQKTENKHQKPFLEGCLSIPRIYGAVMRYPWIRAKATAVNGDLYYPGSGRCEYNRDLFSEFKFKLEGLAARVFQHELDHLNGILFTDHVLAQGNKLYREEGREMAEYP